jgi:hypothetical protein
MGIRDPQRRERRSGRLLQFRMVVRRRRRDHRLDRPRRRRRDQRRQRPPRRLERRPRVDPVEEPDPQRLGRVDTLTGGGEQQSLRPSDHGGEPLGAAPGRHDRQPRLIEPDRHVVGRHPDVGRHRDLRPAAERVTVHDRHHRHRERRDPVAQPPHPHRHRHRPVERADLRQLLQIPAGNERPLAPAPDHQHVRRVTNKIKRRLERVHRRRADRVPHRRPVHRHHRHPVRHRGQHLSTRTARTARSARTARTIRADCIHRHDSPI